MNTISAIWIGVVILTMLGIIAIMIGQSVHAHNLDMAADSLYRDWLRYVEKNEGLDPVMAPPIKLRKGELCYFVDDTADMYEPRSVRTGGYGGGSVHVAKGLTLHTGRMSSESHYEWRKVAVGALYLTNERLIFNGDMQNKVVNIDDIMSVTPGYRVASVSSQKLQKPMAFGDINGQIFVAVLRMLQNNTTEG